MLKGYIKTLSSSPKMYKENCLLMQIAKVLSPTADCSNAHRYIRALLPVLEHTCTYIPAATIADIER